MNKLFSKSSFVLLATALLVVSGFFIAEIASAVIEVSASQSTLIWNNPGVVSTDGGTATFTITAKDQDGNVIPNANVVLSATGNNNSYNPLSINTDINGQAIILLQSTRAENKIVSATINGVLINQTVSALFVASSARNGVITASTVTPEATIVGTTVDLTITITDASGNLVQDGANVTLLTDFGVIGGSGNTINGIIHRTLTGVNKGVAHLTFVGLFAMGDKIINFIDIILPVVGQHENILKVEATSPFGAMVTYENPIATDNIDSSVLVDCVPASDSTFILGITTVTCSAVDSSSNVGTSTFTVEVVDTTLPIITAPDDITKTARGPLTIVDLGLPIVSDIVDQNPTVTDNAPETFPLGTTVVIWTATDGSNNSSTDTQIITVIDRISPAITSPVDQTFEATGPETTPILIEATAVDAVDPNPEITYTPLTFPLGTTVVIWTATDASGRSSSSMSNVTIEDTTPPTITEHENMVTEATSSNGAVVTYENPIATDLVDGISEVNCIPASGSPFDLGDTIVTCTSTDNHSNPSTSTFIVEVVDTTSPTIAIHEDILNVEATSSDGATVNYENPIATDLVDGVSEVDCVPASGSTFALGNTPVICTATDNHGKTATSTFIVRVVDTTAPTIVAPEDVSQEDNGFMSTVVDLGLPIVSDIVDQNPTVTDNAPETFPLGTTIVTWTAIDGWGKSATANQNVTIYASPITHIVLMASPVSLAFDSTSLITVTGYDQYENIVTNNNLTQIILSADGGGSLDNTILTLLSGVATANLSKDSAGIVHVTASSNGLTPRSITVEFTGTDISSPYVESHTPVNGAINVVSNVHPVIVFSESLNTATVSSTNIQLKKYSDDSVVLASVSPAEGDRQVIITPVSPLDFNTQYYFVVLAGVTDKVGNPAVPYGKGDDDNIFTTISDSTVLSVTGISAIKTFALADGTYENGWAWTFNVTVPTAETELQMKFADWTSSLPNTISVANNIRYSSVQANNGPIEITSASTYGANLHLISDLDLQTVGRQIQIKVEAKVPVESQGGSYSTSYGINSTSLAD